MALILVYVTLDRDTQTPFKCVKQSCTICDIIFLGQKTQGSVFQTPTKSLERNVREVVGKPAEITPIPGLLCC